MAVGDGVEGTGVKRDAGHELVYPAARGPASRPVPPDTPDLFQSLP
jgi:hypothetical protein